MNPLEHPAIQAHRTLLEQWRKAMDLVGPGPVEPHFEDAIGAVQGLEATGRWADLGSGAGFPGVALAALHPEAEVLLVESRQKRATFLRRVVRTSGLTNATVVHDRTESLPDGALDGVISRAYKPPLDFLTDAARLLKPGGRAVVLVGDASSLRPDDWTLLADDRYPVTDGWRRRLVFCQPSSTERATP